MWDVYRRVCVCACVRDSLCVHIPCRTVRAVNEYRILVMKRVAGAARFPIQRCLPHTTSEGASIVLHTSHTQLMCKLGRIYRYQPSGPYFGFSRSDMTISSNNRTPHNRTSLAVDTPLVTQQHNKRAQRTATLHTCADNFHHQ